MHVFHLRLGVPSALLSQFSETDTSQDDPLRNFEPLPSIQSAPDACLDLRLVQPPGFLRTCYEMLLGPSKTEATDSELLQLCGDAGSADPKHELPAKAYARVRVVLQSLPRLAKENHQMLRILQNRCVQDSCECGTPSVSRR